MTQTTQIKHGWPENNNPGIIKVKVEYMQQPDTEADSSNDQVLEIWTQGVGESAYICFSTERWAIDDIDEMIAILEDFKRRAGIEIPNNPRKQS